MRPALNTTKSLEDVRPANSLSSPQERRARSQSPVKVRRSLPPSFFDMSLPSLPFATSDDLRSLSSNSSSGNSGSSGSSSLSFEQIKKLSKSPVSKRLHINTKGDNGQYVIPIPFTLTLPPKLSPKSANKTRSRSPSPTRASSPRNKSRLIYTGNGYEKLDTSSSESESEADNTAIRHSPCSPTRSSRNVILSPPQSPPSPTKKMGPPSVNSNKRKSNKSIIQARQLKADELSIIEEQSSSNASSRASSLRDKKEKPAITVGQGETLAEEPLKESATPSRAGSPEKLQPVIPIPIPVNTKKQTKMVRVSESGSPQRGRAKADTEKELPPIVELKTSGVPRMATEGDIAGLKENGFSPSKTQFLQIHKRSFSDESHVSSVSSFSSVGDVYSFASKVSYHNRPQSSGLRNVSGRSVESESSESTISGSEASWDSVQKSIDLAGPGSDSSFEDIKDGSEWEDVPQEKEVSMKKTVTTHSVEDNIQAGVSEAESEVADYYMQNTTDTSADTSIGKSRELETDTESSVSEETTQMESEADESQETIAFESQIPQDPDNRGLGKGFNFPNNFENATNDEMTKKRVISSESRKSNKSRFSYYSTVDGQIEIPDLSEASYSEIGSMRRSVLSVNGTTFNELISDEEEENDADETADATLEPIGFPSQKGKRIITEQFKHLYDSSDSDDDTDIAPTTFSSYGNNVKSKSTTNINAKKFSDLPPLPTQQQQTLTPMRFMHNRSRSHHSRSRSMGNIQFDLNDLINQDKSQELPQAISQSHSEPQDKNDKEDQKEHQPTEESEEQTEKQMDELPMKISVAEPPQRVDYTVDFKDNTQKENELNRTITPTINELRNVRRRSAISGTTQSASSYQSSRSVKSSNSSRTDVESVVIDLTEEKYDVCMIQRSDSTLSYKSTTEVHKGKEVEVVIVEEDEDDLESIYSKYGRNWLGRSASMRSDFSSTSSTFSYNSTASANQIRLKNTPQVSGNGNQLALARGGGVPRETTVNTKSCSRYNSRRIKLPPRVTEDAGEESFIRQKDDNQYFDYSKSNSYYDFNTFINSKS